jgi:hypothetical protein
MGKRTSTKFLARQTFGRANLGTNQTYPWSVVLLEVGYPLLGTKDFIVVVDFAAYARCGNQ